MVRPITLADMRRAMVKTYRRINTRHWRYGVSTPANDCGFWPMGAA